jgi:hypothetical protein
MWTGILAVAGSKAAIAVASLLLSGLFGSAWWLEYRKRNNFLTGLLEAVCDVVVQEVEQKVVAPRKAKFKQDELDPQGQAIAQTIAEVRVGELLKRGGAAIPQNVTNGAIRDGVKAAVQRMRSLKVD